MSPPNQIAARAPQWLFNYVLPALLFVATGVTLYAIFFLKEPRYLFGLRFGPEQGLIGELGIATIGGSVSEMNQEKCLADVSAFFEDAGEKVVRHSNRITSSAVASQGSDVISAIFCLDGDGDGLVETINGVVVTSNRSPRVYLDQLLERFAMEWGVQR